MFSRLFNYSSCQSLGNFKIAFFISVLLVVCTVCLGLFAILLGVIGRLYSVTVTLPRHILYYNVQI